MGTKKAFALLELKAAAESGDLREFTGIATTPTPDRIGDVVEPDGAQFRLPLPLLWQHDSRSPIGEVTSARVTAKGIEVKGRIVNFSEPGKLKDLLDFAWHSIKAGLVKGLSIGFRVLESSQIKDTWSEHITKWEWLELSPVTIPMNSEASITSIKAAALLEFSAASGTDEHRKGTVSLRSVRTTNSPGVSGRQLPNGKGSEMKTIAEQLAAYDTRRKTAVTRADELMTKSAEEERTLDDAEDEEYKGLVEEIKKIDEHMARLKTHEKLQLSQATPVSVDTGRGEGGVEIRGSGPVSVRRNIPEGTSFTRYCMALASSKGNLMQAEKIAERWKDTPEVSLVLKAATQEGTTADATWAGSLVQYQDMVSEFINLLRARTILGRLPLLRRVPFNIRIQRQTAGTTGTFVGEGLPTPVRELAAESVTLPWAKASTIVVVSAELARFSSPSAEAMVRDDLLGGISEYLDKRLVDPAYPGVANVSPASLTNGVTPTQASGASIAAIDADTRAVEDAMGDANLDLSSAVWVMSSSQANRLSKIRTAMDDRAYPDINVNGGAFDGIPVIVSNNVSPSGSPGDQHMILINQREVLLADDGQMTIDVSSEASLEFDDAPTGGATSLRSLWQNGLLGLKVERWIYWAKRRTQACQFIDKAQSYGS